MKREIIVIMVLFMMMGTHASAQQEQSPGKDNHLQRLHGNRPPEKPETLSMDQQAQVKAILSRYNPSSLTVDDAKAIHEDFRQAGLRAGPAMAPTIIEAGFDPDQLRDLAPPPCRGKDDNGPYDSLPSSHMQTTDSFNDRQQNHRQDKPEATQSQRYSIEQAISDRAQLNTIAFSGLAFITGEFGASTFIPPGKVCDFFGFQYMRDIDAAGKGHNPLFLNRVVGNLMHVLNDEQIELFRDLAMIQTDKLESLALRRLPLIKAFHRELDGDLPNSSPGLNRDAVIKYVGELFRT